MLLIALEYFLAILVTVLVTTEMVVPLWNGERLFPLVRGRKRRDEYVQAQDELVDLNSQRTIESLRRLAQRQREAMADTPPIEDRPIPTADPKETQK